MSVTNKDLTALERYLIYSPGEQSYMIMKFGELIEETRQARLILAQLVGELDEIIKKPSPVPVEERFCLFARGSDALAVARALVESWKVPA